MPNTADNTKTEERITEIKDYTTLPFWLRVWGGTTVAGGVFGFLVGCWGDGPAVGGFCLIVGVVLAGMFGGFTIANVAFVTWCFWLSRFRVLMGGLAGGVTGVIATLSVIGWMSPIDSWTWLAVAGVFGTLGGGLAGGRFHARERLPEVFLQHPWRFTLRDLFIRITVISALLATYVFLGKLILASRIVR
jgi:hypothetical protein